MRSLFESYAQRDFPSFQRALVPQKGQTKVSAYGVNRLDLRGKAVLHHAVSSLELARWDYVVALLSCPAVNVNVQDVESGWTPLHRALYTGNLEAARALIAHANIDLGIRDHEGLTAFDLYNASVDGVNPSKDQGQSELYAWGSNRNFTLGFRGDGDRPLPERILLPKAPHPEQEGKQGNFRGINVQDIAMAKFQTGVLTDEKAGNVRFCGSSMDGRMNKNAASARVTYESLPGLTSCVVQVAVATDHTVLLDDRGDVLTFGMNHHGQLGYPLEGDEIMQTSPKRVIGLRKERVMGVAASRVHSVAFTEESLYTWGASRGQLGYSTPGSSIQSVPRKVSTLASPVQLVVATEHATVCLLVSQDVLVFQKNAYYKMVFNLQRFPQSKQIYRPPQLAYESKPVITKIAGCGINLVALSQMGDVFSWVLDDSDTPQSTVARSPQRVWDRRKQFTGVVDVAVGSDTLVMATVSGHVYVRQKRMDVIKGADLRGASAASTSGRKLYKVTRMPFLQRVVRVAANDCGGFAAIRADAPVTVPLTTGRSLAQDLGDLLPHLAIAPKNVDLLRPPEDEPSWRPNDPNERQIEIEAEVDIVKSFIDAAAEWDASWSEPRGGADVIIVAKGGKEVPAHKAILASRSAVLQRVLDERPANTGESIRLEPTLSAQGLERIAMRRHSLLAILLTLLYIYTDSPLALWDARIALRFRSIGIAAVRDELHVLAHQLQLPALARILALPERTMPEPTLSVNMSVLLDSVTSRGALQADCTLELADNEHLLAHKVLLRARCPFLAAMFADADWTAQRRASKAGDTLAIDLRSLDVTVMRMVLRHLYTDEGVELFRGVVQPSADAYIDFVFQVMAAANELLLDRLKVVCSAVLCSFVNLQTVAAIFSDADFYHADDLAESCMLYLSRNMETALEGRYLDDFPVALLRRLSAFCRRRQEQKLPISRSQEWIDALMAKHFDYCADLDLAKPFTGKRRWKFPTRSPRLSPVDVPLPASLPTAPSPMMAARRPSSGPSPLLEALVEPLESPPASPTPQPQALSDEPTFAMDELEGDRLVTSPNPRSRTQPWGMPAITADIPPLDLRNIMANETTNARQVLQRSRPPSEASIPSGTPVRQSQRDRRKPAAGADVTPSPPMSSSPWRPQSVPGWRLAESAKSTSLAAIQSEQQLNSSPGQNVFRKPVQANVTPAPPFRRPPLQSSSTGSIPRMSAVSPSDKKASAVGAPVITPVRPVSSAKVRTSAANGQDTAWVNYMTVSPSFFSPPSPTMPDTPSPGGSFAAIQNQQHDEGEAIRSAKRAPKSLAEIQEEERFMQWWADESAKAQASSAPISPAGRGRGRGRSRIHNRGRGGGARNSVSNS